MPTRAKKGGASFARHAAPFAPLAIAVAMQTTHTVSPAHHGNGSFQPVCSLPFDGVPNPDIDDECGIEGGSSNVAKQAESRAKNNFCASGRGLRSITYEDLVQLQRGSTGIPKSLPDRSRLESMGEGDYVSYIAFIKQAHYSDVGNGEAVNCNIPGNSTNDIHIVLMKDPEDKDECDSTTAEMSPHYRPAEWTPENLDALTDRPVRIQGQLFYDGSHTPCTDHSRPNPKRVSLWEIHPVYSVDVCSEETISDCSTGNAQWTPLSEYFSSEHK
jgi:hypothetical protein